MLDKKYLKWVKFDLHHHTVEDKSPKRKKGSQIEYQKILDCCDKNDVKLIAITDHNKISWSSYDKFRTYIQKNNLSITVLPGMEMNFKLSKSLKKAKKFKNNYLDINFIFDENQSEEIKKFWNKFKDDNKICEDSRLFYPEYYNKICNKLKDSNIKYVTLLSDKKSSNSVDNLSLEYKHNLANYPFFDFFEGNTTNIRTGTKEIFEQKHGTTKLPIQTKHSDLEEITLPLFQKAVKKLSWYLGEWSFRGLLKIAINYEKRIATTSEKPPILDEYIEEIHIKNHEKPLILTPGLNVIVGKRGSGKSFLMKKIYEYIKNHDQSNKKSNKNDFIEKINYNDTKKIQPKQIFYFEQEKIAKAIQKLENEIFIDHKETIKKVLQQSSLPYIFNNNPNETSDNLKQTIKKIKAEYIKIKINFQELIKTKLAKIKKQIKTNYLNKIKIFKNKIKQKFNVEIYDNYKTKINDDLTVLQQAKKNTKLLWIKEELSNIINQLNNENKKILEWEPNIQLMRIVFSYSKTLLKKSESESNAIISQIEDTFQKVIDSTVSFAQSNKKLILLIQTEHNLFIKYQNDYQIYQNNIKSESLEKNVYFCIRFRIKASVDFKSDYWKALLLFYYNRKPILDKNANLNSLNELINLTERKTKNHTNDYYYDLFDVQIDSYIDKTKIEDLSAGQRQEKFLKLYFEQEIDYNIKKVLMFDQPGDNLDSETITKFLIEEFIYKKRFLKQIIIVTHDSKIALNADPQRIIYSNFDIQNQNNECYENIDTFSLNKDKIYSLLDGRKEFPLQRFKDYGGYYDRKRNK